MKSVNTKKTNDIENRLIQFPIKYANLAPSPFSSKVVNIIFPFAQVENFIVMYVIIQTQIIKYIYLPTTTPYIKPKMHESAVFEFGIKKY